MGYVLTVNCIIFFFALTNYKHAYLYSFQTSSAYCYIAKALKMVASKKVKKFIVFSNLFIYVLIKIMFSLFT